MTEGRALALAGVVAGALGGCTLITDSFLTNEFSGDAFPIKVDSTNGAIMVGMRRATDTEGRVAVLDLLSPFTVIDQDPGIDPLVSFVDLTLLGDRGNGQLDLPRARFPEAQLISLHPCSNECGPDDPDTCDPKQCNVGVPSARRPYEGIVGSDVLAGDAVRLRLGDNQMFILADVGGSERGRSLSCDAVFDSPYRGGGTLVIAGTELPFGNRRITLRACLGLGAGPGPNPDVDTLHPTGADALLVVSTSIGISILDEAAYQRYLIVHPEAPPLAALAPDTVYLPSGAITGRRATIDRLALVAAPTSNALAPCRQVYAHRLQAAHELTSDDCRVDGTGKSRLDCPCKNGDLFCSVPAMIELEPASGIDVLVVPETEPTLQALRTELRPDQPEVDGLLGTDALRSAEIDVDYPHDRLLARCTQGGCTTRPQLAQFRDRCQINHCIYGSGNQPGC